MVLVQWLADKRYLNFYRKRRSKGDFIILDNGACELGKSVSVGNLIRGYRLLGGCNVLVIPDSNEGNIWLFKDFLDNFTLHYGDIDREVKLMAAPHSLDDLDIMAGLSRVDYIGLNRDFEDYGRAKVIEQYKDCGKKFHLLGIRKNPVEEIAAVKDFGDLMLGFDSSFPYRLLSRGRTIMEPRPYPSHDSMYQRDLSPEVLNFCIGEFKSFLEWVENE